MSFGPWNYESQNYALGQINLGSNPLSKVEIVSVLNSFNYATFSWWYDAPYATPKYNPKVYMSTVQSVSKSWLYDYQTGQTNGLGRLPEGGEKSGSYIVNG
ncbi:MAG TPA: hypothetical protein DCY93_03100 [Firmicutes bacterium]|nr:hypothetical protein [Bacillota bacterium]